MVRRILTSGLMLAALSWSGTGTAWAQGNADINLAVTFTFARPVALPRVTLPPGKYMFRLVGPDINRTVVRVADMSGKQYGMFMTMPIERNTYPNDPEVRFLEAGGNSPNAIATYWYPGRKSGWEFIYPRSQAMQLAQSSKQSVLTTATEVSDDNMGSAPVVRVNPTGAAAAPASGALDVSGESARGEVETPAAPALAAQEPAPQRVARARLPETASLMPLVTPVGGMLLAAALLVGFWRRRAA